MKTTGRQGNLFHYKRTIMFFSLQIIYEDIEKLSLILRETSGCKIWRINMSWIVWWRTDVWTVESTALFTGVSQLGESDPWRSLRLEDECAHGFDVLRRWHAEMEAQQDLDRRGGERAALKLWNQESGWSCIAERSGVSLSLSELLSSS